MNLHVCVCYRLQANEDSDKSIGGKVGKPSGNHYSVRINWISFVMFDILFLYCPHNPFHSLSLFCVLFSQLLLRSRVVSVGFLRFIVFFFCILRSVWRFSPPRFSHSIFGLPSIDTWIPFSFPIVCLLVRWRIFFFGKIENELKTMMYWTRLILLISIRIMYEFVSNWNKKRIVMCGWMWRMAKLASARSVFDFDFVSPHTTWPNSVE